MIYSMIMAEVKQMNKTETIVKDLVQELHRGSLVLMVLSQLTEPQYGYSLVQRLDEKGLPLEPGTLYPLLRRLEKQDLLDSQWDTETNRPRRYYVLSATGRTVLEQLVGEWHLLSRQMDQMIKAGTEIPGR